MVTAAPGSSLVGQHSRTGTRDFWSKNLKDESSAGPVRSKVGRDQDRISLTFQLEGSLPMLKSLAKPPPIEVLVVHFAHRQPKVKGTTMVET